MISWPLCLDELQGKDYAVFEREDFASYHFVGGASLYRVDL